ncbi:hypothetical protein [Streptomyces sp. NPDC001661]
MTEGTGGHLYRVPKDGGSAHANIARGLLFLARVARAWNGHDGAMPSAYSNLDRYYGCRFGRGQLNRMAEIMEDGLPPGSVTFETRFGTYRFEASTLAQLVADVTSSPDVAVPDQWDNLTIKAPGPGAGTGVTVAIDGDRTAVTVEAQAHATWAYGLEARLRVFLTTQAAGRYESRSSPEGRELRKESFFTALWAAALWYGIFVLPGHKSRVTLDNGEQALTQPAGPVPKYQLALFAVLFLWSAKDAVGAFIRLKTGRPILFVQAELPTGTAWSRLSSMDRTAVAAVIVAAVAMIGTLVSAGADVLKP